jgi:rsbT co-antagonist protein RsbR
MKNETERDKQETVMNRETSQETFASLEDENQHLREQVAELKAERDEARARCKWMEELLEQSNIPICLWHGDNLVYTFANRAYLQRTGKPDAIGKPLRAVFDEDEVPGLMELIEQAYTSGERQVIPEARVSLQNVETEERETSWHNLIHNPVRNAQDKVIGVSLFAVDVTEQVQARYKLHQQAQILDQTPGSIIVTDMQGTIISWNQASTTIYGYTREEMIGKPITMIYPPEERERLRTRVIQPLQVQGSLETETLAWNKAGHRFPLQLSLSLLHDESGTPVGMIGYSLDISERKQQQETLYSQMELFTNLLDTLPFPVFYKDSQGIYRGCNRVFAEDFMGKTIDDIVDKGLYDLLPPEQAAFYQQVDTDLLHHGGLQIYERDVTFADGSRHAILFHKSVYTNPDGTPGGIIGAMIDVTERKKQEENLRTFQSVVENSPDGVSFVSPDGIIIYGNPAMKTLLGYGDEYIGLPVPVVFGGNSDIPMQIIQHVIEHGSWTGPQTYYRKDGSMVTVHVSMFAIRNEDGEVLSFPGIVRDMTDVQEAEAERAALQQQIIDAQRAALRELSAPLLPISKETIVLPLVGTIDSQRAQQIMEVLLEGVAEHHAEIAIVDITGVQVVDTQVANALMQTAQAVRLLGAQVVLTGIGPSMAQTLVSLGVDLSDIVTRGTLQNGISYALE